MSYPHKKNMTCEICGSIIYDGIRDKKSWKEIEEGPVHTDCLRREKAQQKTNRNLEQGLLHV